MMRKLLLTGLMMFGIFALAFCGSGQSKTVALTKSDSGKSVDLKQGDQLQVTLEGNPTTGYQWEIVPADQTVLQPISDPQFTSNSKLIGSGGSYVFTWKATSAGQTVLKLIYHRSFEPDVAPIDTFEITVNIS